MTQTIRLKRSATASNVPTTAQLALGEMAINTYDGKVYIKKDNGTESIVLVNSTDADTVDGLHASQFLRSDATDSTTGSLTVSGSLTAGSVVVDGVTFDNYTGNYGSIQISGGATGGYQGYGIEGEAVFMYNGTNTTGIYNDTHNQWIIRGTFAGATELYYAGSSKLTTASGGVSVTGTLTTTGIADVVNVNETVYSLTGTALSASNGGIQYKTLTANTSFTDSLSTGDSIVLRLSGGDTYTVTWPTMTWVTSSGNTAPTLSGSDVFVLWKEGTTLYGTYVGDYS